MSDDPTKKQLRKARRPREYLIAARIMIDRAERYIGFAQKPGAAAMVFYWLRRSERACRAAARLAQGANRLKGHR